MECDELAVETVVYNDDLPPNNIVADLMDQWSYNSCVTIYWLQFLSRTMRQIINTMYANAMNWTDEGETSSYY